MRQQGTAAAGAGQFAAPCPDRVLGAAGQDAVCGFVPRWLNGPPELAPTVTPDTCAACAQAAASSSRCNSVQASLAYAQLARIASDGGIPECSAARARHLLSQLGTDLPLVVTGAQERWLPPAQTERASAAQPRLPAPAATGSAVERWMVGLMTAPRPRSTIAGTIDSLIQAGFEGIHIFAEPRAKVPRRSQCAAVTFNARTLGSLANFVCGLAALLETDPTADAYVMFQDDIVLASGLREWCEAELWPFDHGLVSLFTPRIHAGECRGWQIRRPGGPRIHGGQALVFRRDVLADFLNDRLVIDSCRRKGRGCDRLVSDWATRSGSGVAYFTPSLVRHVGHASSIDQRGPDPLNFSDSVDDPAEIGNWNPAPARVGRVLLVGADARSGLGHLNRDLAERLPVHRWMIPRRGGAAPDSRATLPCEVVELSFSHLSPRSSQLARCLDGMEWLLFAETPYHPALIQAARAHGLRIACIPMWERLSHRTPWLGCVDVMVCPTRIAAAHYLDWQRRYGFGYDVVVEPWPIAVDRFPFCRRERCERFLFVNGAGGDLGRRRDGSQLAAGRKGLDIVLAAARQVPRIPIHICSQVSIAGDVPSNVTLHPAMHANSGLYDHGDVCIQPSRWEGIGLQLLECQAAGLPLITTQAPPMNEFQSLAEIRVRARESVWLGHEQPVLSHEACPDHLAHLMRSYWRTDLGAASESARRWVEAHHSWQQSRERFGQFFSLR